MTEENETVEFIKAIININKENERTATMLYVSDVDILLNLIEKLQKENEDLKKQKVEYLDKIYNKIDNLKYEYKKAEMHYDSERASFYRDLIRHFEKLLEEE